MLVIVKGLNLLVEFLPGEGPLPRWWWGWRCLTSQRAVSRVVPRVRIVLETTIHRLNLLSVNVHFIFHHLSIYVCHVIQSQHYCYPCVF